MATRWPVKGGRGPLLGIASHRPICRRYSGNIPTYICEVVPLANFSLRFGPAEYFSLIVMGMLTIVFVGGKSITKSLISGVIGLALGVVGIDPVRGSERFVWHCKFGGRRSVYRGGDGVYGIGEVLESWPKSA